MAIDSYVTQMSTVQIVDVVRGLFVFHLRPMGLNMLGHQSDLVQTLPSFLWLLRIFPSLPGSRLTNLYHDASSALV